MRTTLLIFPLTIGLAGVALAGGDRPSLPDRVAGSTKLVPVSISWAMAERFGPGYDRNQDRRPDLPNTYDYVNPGRYEVQLFARVDAKGDSADEAVGEWSIESGDRAIRLKTKGFRPRVQLPPGPYSVTVTVRLSDGKAGSARETILVKDILIVVLGDSLATGEGNPEEPARWDGTAASARGWFLRGRLDPSTPARWADGGPAGDQPRSTGAGTLPPANVLHAAGPSLNSLGGGPARDAPGGRRSSYFGHVRLPGRHRRTDR